MSVFSYQKGKSPLLISMPHAGTVIPNDVASKMTDIGRSSRDSDWYVEKLYEFAKQKDVHWLEANYSRYLIDLNRDSEGHSLYPGTSTTELCPTTSFDNQDLYRNAQIPTDAEINLRIKSYWQPYHQQIRQSLDQIKQEFGFAFFLEAHSIASIVPRFFSGQLSDFNFGTNNGLCCDDSISRLIEDMSFGDYSKVINGRFKGGYISRAYGDPQNNIHGIQLELSQATYLDESDLSWDENKATKVVPYLEKFVDALLRVKL